MSENISNTDKLETINELFSLLFQADAEYEEQDLDEQANYELPEQDDSQLVVPIVDTINSIIARNLKRLDERGTVLSPLDLKTLAELSHVIRLSDNKA